MRPTLALRRLAATGLAALVVLAALAPPAGAQERESLEDLLRRARSERKKVHDRLRPQVDSFVEALGALEPDSPTRKMLLDKLAALGTEAVPLIVPYLSPSPPDDATARVRAAVVARALVDMPKGAALDDLLALARGDNAVARGHAIEVLGHASKEATIVGPQLVALYRDPNAPADVRLAVIAALARLGGPDNLALIGSALQDAQSSSVVAAALVALAEGAHAQAAPDVVALLQSPSAPKYTREILRYFQSCRGAVDDGVVGALMRLAADARVGEKELVFLLGSIPDFAPGWKSEWRDILEPLVTSSDNDVKEAALICLACLGDRRSKSDVLTYYDQVVHENENWPKGYEQRADVLMRLREYADAAKDYEKAIKLSRSGPEFTRAMWLGLARAHARAGKVRDAHKTLEVSPLEPATIRELANDPDFRELRDHSRYGKIFE